MAKEKEQNFDTKAQKVLLDAQSIAKKMGHQVVEPLHLLYSLVSNEDNEVFELLQKLKVDCENLREKVEKELKKIPRSIIFPTSSEYLLSQEMAEVLNKSKKIAMNFGITVISSPYFLLALLDTDTKARKILDETPFLLPSGAIYKKLEYKTVLEEIKKSRVAIIYGKLIAKYEYVEGGDTRWILRIELSNKEIVEVKAKVEELTEEDIKRILNLQIGESLSVQFDKYTGNFQKFLQKPKS